MNDDFLVVKLILQDCINPIIVDGYLIDCEYAKGILKLPYGLLGMSGYCLSGQSDLKSIYIPSTIVDVQGNPLSNCSNLKTIYLPVHLKHFKSQLNFANEAEVVYVYSS